MPLLGIIFSKLFPVTVFISDTIYPFILLVMNVIAHWLEAGFQVFLWKRGKGLKDR